MTHQILSSFNLLFCLSDCRLALLCAPHTPRANINAVTRQLRANDVPREWMCSACFTRLCDAEQPPPPSTLSTHMRSSCVTIRPPHLSSRHARVRTAALTPHQNGITDTSPTVRRAHGPAVREKHVRARVLRGRRRNKNRRKNVRKDRQQQEGLCTHTSRVVRELCVDLAHDRLIDVVELIFVVLKLLGRHGAASHAGSTPCKRGNTHTHEVSVCAKGVLFSKLALPSVLRSLLRQSAQVGAASKTIVTTSVATQPPPRSPLCPLKHTQALHLPLSLAICGRHRPNCTPFCQIMSVAQ